MFCKPVWIALTIINHVRDFCVVELTKPNDVQRENIHFAYKSSMILLKRLTIVRLEIHPSLVCGECNFLVDRTKILVVSPRGSFSRR